MVARGSEHLDPTVDQIMHWGADNAGNVLIYGEWWRIVTAMFVHVGILHLATNMWCLWNLGLLAEPLMGSFGLFAVYILTGAAGNLLSTLVQLAAAHSRPPAATYFSRPAREPPGAVFGIAGGADYSAQVEATARAAVRTEKTAQVRHLFCRDQPGHRLLHQLRQRIDRFGIAHRQLGAHGRLLLRAALRRSAWCRASARRAAFFKCACGWLSPAIVSCCWCCSGFTWPTCCRRKADLAAPTDSVRKYLRTLLVLFHSQGGRPWNAAIS